MPKINQEEYEKIKLLPDYDWNWIAREKTGKILSFTNKPTKTDEVWKYKQTRLWFNYKDSQLFQFIQWEDAEPYEIAELIEEYEKDYKGSWEYAIEFSKEMRRESEETEVNKYTEWLKEEVNKILRDKVADGINYYDYMDLKRPLNELINQLDKIEVLSQDWIDENKTSIDRKLDGTPIYKIREELLQNLLVPKQEEITHKQVEKYLLDKNIRVIDIDIYEEMQSELEELKNDVTLSKTETVADVVTTFWKSYERLKEVMSMEVEELEE